MSIAMLFPGQGSQSPASGAPWRDDPSWSLVERASTATGVDVAHLLLDAGEDELRDTANAQLSTFVVSLVVAEAARRDGLHAEHAAGHSLGEYTALVAGGAVEFEEGCRLVAARGAAMRAASAERPGTMAAIIGLEEHVVADACSASGQEVWVANDNAPGQVVVAGAQAGIDAITPVLKAAGGRAPMPLKVAGAFHTPYMASAQTALDHALHQTEFRSTDVELWANVDAAQHDDPASWPSVLSDQLCSAVRWRDEIDAMARAGVTAFVELGPGNVLAGMVKRIAPDAVRASAATPEQVAQVLASLTG